MSCPFLVIKKLATLLGIDENELKKNIVGIGMRGRGIRIKNPELVINFDKSLARLLGHIYGDGSIHYNKVISYTNKNLKLTNEFKNLSKDVFGNLSIHEEFRLDDETNNIYLPKLCGLILDKCFKNFNKKRVPLELFNSNPELVVEFLAAIFDDEGCVKVNSKELAIVLKDKKMIEDVSYLFLIAGIKTSCVSEERKNKKSYWRIRIYRRKNFIKFRKQIKLKHRNKIKSLNKLLSSYTLRFTKYELEEAIIDKLKKYNLVTASELTRELNIRIDTCCKTLARLENKNIVEKYRREQLDNLKRRHTVNLWCLNGHYSN